MTLGPEASPGGPQRRTFGFSYEDFLGQFYGALVSRGVPTRAGLRKAGFSDHDIDLGAAELASRGFLKETEDPDTWEVAPPRAAFSAYAVEMQHRLDLARVMLGPMELMWRRSLGRERGRELPRRSTSSLTPTTSATAS